MNSCDNDVQNFIIEHQPCGNAREWLRAGKFQTMADAWNACPRGDWMMWAIHKTGKAPRQKLILLACDFAERTLHIYENKFPNDTRPRAAVDSARQYANGEISIAELEKAKRAASDAYDAAYAAADAAYEAAANAAYAAYAAYDAAAAAAAAAAAYDAYAASKAAYADAYAAAYADASTVAVNAYAAAAATAATAATAAASAKAAERMWQANRIRKVVGNPFKKNELE